MKTITNYLRLMTLLCFTGVAGVLQAQTCVAGFTYSAGPGGLINFTSTATPANSLTSYYWNFGNNNTFTATGSAGVNPGHTYTANGTYVVSLFFLNSVPSCSAAIQQTITVNNAGPCSLVPNFNYSQGSNGLVNFNSTSTGTTGSTTYLWLFGDNSNNGTGASTAHTYSANGQYNVILLVNNNTSPLCMDTVSALVNVTSYTCNLNAGFNYSINANGNVSFYNTTTPSVAVSYSWNFGNNTGSGAMNPSATYSSNGTYVVTLSASSGSNCVSNVSQTITITNSGTCTINANFTASQWLNGQVSFNNTSTGTGGGTTYNWNFGDGSSTVSTTSPLHTYTANGSYTVTLLASNNTTPACTSTKTMVINVTTVCNLNASYSYTIGSNGVVNFLSTSTGTQSGYIHTWFFGDGNSATGAATSHTYMNGTYYAVLLVTNSNSVNPTCQDTVVQQIVVTTNTCVASAHFTLVPTGTPKYWNAIPSTTGNVVSAIWNWGDGNTSNTLYTAHQYSAAGTYDICLSVTLSCGASDTYCMPYSVYRSSGNAAGNDVIYINVINAETVGMIDNVKNNEFFTLYPNPGAGVFYINMKGLRNEIATLSAFNITGSLVYSRELKTPDGVLNEELDLKAVGNGIYFIQVSSGNRTYTKKIAINR